MSDEANIGDDRLAYPVGLVEKFARAMCERWTYVEIGTPDGDAEWEAGKYQYRAMALAGFKAIQNDWLWANVIEHAIREAERK